MKDYEAPPARRGKMRRSRGLLVAVAVALLLAVPTVLALSVPRGPFAPLPGPATTPATGPLGAIPQSGGLPFVQSTWELASGRVVAGAAISGTGLEPSGIAVDAAAGRVYVSNAGSPFLTVLNLTAPAVAAFVPLPAAYGGPVASVDGWVYVAEASGTIALLNASRTAIEGNLTVGASPDAVAVDAAAGELFIGEGARSRVDLVSTVSRSVLGTFSTNVVPQALAFDPVHDRLLVAGGSNSVEILNASSGAPTANLTVGNFPLSAAYDALTDRFYVGTMGSMNISVIDAASERVAGAYGVATTVAGLAVGPDGRRLYASGQTGGNLTVINATAPANRLSIALPGPGNGVVVDAATNEVVDASDEVTVLNASTDIVSAHVATQFAPVAAVAAGSTGRLYAADEYSNLVRGLNLSTNTSLATTPVPDLPTAEAFDPASGQLFVVTTGADAVAVLDAATGRETTTFATGLSPTGIAIDPSLHRLFVTENGEVVGASVAVFSTTNDQAIGSFSLPGPSAIGYCARTQEVYVVYGPGSASLAAIDPVTFGTNATGSVGGGADSVVCDPASGLVLTANWFGGNLSVLNGTTLDPIAAFAMGGHPSGLAVDTDNGYVFATNSVTGNVTVLDPAALTIRENLSVGPGPWGVSYDPLSRMVYVAEMTNGAVGFINPNVPPPTVASVQVTPTAANLAAGAVQDFAASATNSFGYPAPPGVVFTWSLSPPGIGTLNSSVGSSVAFTAGSASGGGALYVNATLAGTTVGTVADLTVQGGSAGSGLGSLTVSPAVIDVGVLEPQAVFALALNLTGGAAPATTVYRWSLSPTNLGTLNTTTGALVTVTGEIVGTGSLTVTATDGSSTLVDSASVTVAATAPSPLARLRVGPSAVTAVVGARVALTADAVALDGTNLTDSAFYTWGISSGYLGALASNHSASAVFTAGPEPAQGWVVVTAWVGSTSRLDQVNISVELAPVQTPLPTTSTHHGPPPVLGLPYVDVAGAIGVLIAIELLALFLWRETRGRPTPATAAPGPTGPTAKGAAGPGPSDDTEPAGLGPAEMPRDLL